MSTAVSRRQQTFGAVEHESKAGSAKSCSAGPAPAHVFLVGICTCLKCLSNIRCKLSIAASGFLVRPGPKTVKYAPQVCREHLPRSADLSFCVIRSCGCDRCDCSGTSGKSSRPFRIVSSCHIPVMEEFCYRLSRWSNSRNSARSRAACSGKIRR